MAEAVARVRAREKVRDREADKAAAAATKAVLLVPEDTVYVPNAEPGYPISEV
jgi:hypothetical protein